MIKRILLTCAVLLGLSVIAVLSGITSLPQVLLFVLIVAFFAVLVKGAIEGAPSHDRRIQ